MPYTFEPEEKHAKAFGRNVRISAKDAKVVCAVIRGKKLSTARRLLLDLETGARNLRGKYYTKAVARIKQLLESCAANAAALGLDEGRLFVHAGAHAGPVIRRQRRKAGFGSRMKSTHVEVMLVEKGKGV